jgi:RNA polymerase primary sigma factor
MRAVERFDFARGNRFTTYAAWAVLHELAQYDRKLRRRHVRVVGLHDVCLATEESETERYEREEAQDVRRATLARLLGRLDGRERRVLEHRHGIGGAARHSLQQIGRDMGISKERVRQIEQRAHARLLRLARLEAIELASL